MRIIRAFLYTAFLACANVAVAGGVDPSLLTGAMAKLTLEDPKPLPQVALVTVLRMVIVTLPLAMLIAFIGMGQFGLSANLMSLGGLAIAIGLMVDGSVVVV